MQNKWLTDFVRKIRVFKFESKIWIIQNTNCKIEDKFDTECKVGDFGKSVSSRFWLALYVNIFFYMFSVVYLLFKI